MVGGQRRPLEAPPSGLAWETRIGVLKRSRIRALVKSQETPEHL